MDYFNRVTGQFTNYNERDSGLASDWVHAVFYDSKGRLWVGTTYGLNRLNNGTGSFEHYLAQPGVEGALESNQIVCFLEDSQERLWLGTSNGLYRLDEEADTFVRYDRSIKDNYITSIEEDQNGQIWFGTLGLLYRLDSVSGRVFSFDEEDGLQRTGL